MVEGLDRKRKQMEGRNEPFDATLYRHLSPYQRRIQVEKWKRQLVGMSHKKKEAFQKRRSEERAERHAQRKERRAKLRLEKKAQQQNGGIEGDLNELSDASNNGLLSQVTLQEEKVESRRVTWTEFLRFNMDEPLSDDSELEEESESEAESFLDNVVDELLLHGDIKLTKNDIDLDGPLVDSSDGNPSDEHSDEESSFEENSESGEQQTKATDITTAPLPVRNWPHCGARHYFGAQVGLNHQFTPPFHADNPYMASQFYPQVSSWLPIMTHPYPPPVPPVNLFANPHQQQNQLHSSTNDINAVTAMCKNGHWQLCLQWLISNPSLGTQKMRTSKNGYTTTVLHEAITSQGNICERVEVIQWILKTTPSAATLKDSYGDLPLHAICQPTTKVDAKTRENLIGALILAYPDALLMQADPHNWTPLHIICTDYVSSKIFQMMIENGKKAVFMQDRYGFLPIHVAVSWCCSLEKLEMLLKVHPMSICAKTKDSMTLLELATKTAHPKLHIAALIKKIRDISSREAKQDTLNDVSNQANTGNAHSDGMNLSIANSAAIKTNVVNSVIVNPGANSTNDVTSVIPYPASGSKSEINSVIVESAPTNAADIDSVIAMGRNGHWKSCLRCILKNPTVGAQTMKMPNNGYVTTILHQAITGKGDINDRAEVILQVLKTTPSAAAIKNGAGALPLHTVCWSKVNVDAKTKEKLIRALILAYPDALLMESGRNNRTPLNIICRDSVSPEIIHMMIEHGKKAVFMQDRNGFLPIHIAASRHCSLKKLDLLLEVHPMSIFIETKDGMSPLDIAKETASGRHPKSALIAALSRKMKELRKTSYISSNQSPIQSSPENVVDLTQSDEEI